MGIEPDGLFHSFFAVAGLADNLDVRLSAQDALHAFSKDFGHRTRSFGLKVDFATQYFDPLSHRR
jgi:hypothetical protein